MGKGKALTCWAMALLGQIPGFDPFLAAGIHELRELEKLSLNPIFPGGGQVSSSGSILP